MPKRRKVTFYFDYISHNAYIAWIELQRLRDELDFELVPRPVLFAALLAANKQLGPAEIKPKLEWMTENVLRKAKLLDIPLAPPASHPFKPLLALRASLVAIDAGCGDEFVERLFTACWAESKDVSDPKVIQRLAQELGLDGDLVITESQSQTTKDKLSEVTKSAIDEGVFGVPTMIVDQTLFWGFDDFQYLTLYLQGNDPLDPGVLDQWRKVKPSAVRNAVKP